MRSRRTVLASAAFTAVAALGLSACSSDAAGTSETADGGAALRLALNYVGTVEHYAPYYAQQEGLFSDEGLDVEITPGGDTPGTTLLAAGQTDIAITDTTNLLSGVAEGQDFVAFATEFQMSPLSMTCRADSGVQAPEDLAGHTIGLKSGATDYLPIILSSAGLTESDITIAPIGNQDVAMIISGQVDCMFSSFAFNEPRSIEDAGVDVNVLPMSELGLPAQGNVYVTTREKAESMHDELVSFVRAMGEANVQFLADPDAAAAYMVDNAFTDGLDLEQQEFQANAQVDFISTDWTRENGLMSLNPAAWTATAEAAAEFGITPELIDTSEMIDDLTDDAGTAHQ